MARLQVGVFAALLALGCGGQSRSEIDNTHAGGAGGGKGGSGGDAGIGGNIVPDAPDGGSGPTSFSVKVRDEAELPISGATVYVDGPSDFRELGTTDSAGVATFYDIDFSAGEIDVTAFSPERYLVSVLDVPQTDSEIIELPLLDPWAACTRVITVNVVNMVAAEDVVAASTNVVGAGTDFVPPSIGLQVAVAPGASGKILALESDGMMTPAAKLVAAAVVDIPTSGDSVDVDFAKSMPIEHASGTILAPTYSNPNDTSNGVRVDVRSNVKYALLNAAVSGHSALLGDTITWQADFVRPLSDSEVRTSYGGFGIDAFVYSTVSGYPTTNPPPLPSVPSLKPLPATPFETIEWIAGPDRPNQIVIEGHATNYPRWLIWIPAEWSSVTLRKPPDAVLSGISYALWDQMWAQVNFSGPCPPGNGSGCSLSSGAFAPFPK